ncbi:hypothetical protein MTY66_36850 [Mycolicibacterium sp. TY66]|nr:hypothetical protein MTY66_36850 [Mycolicibacterium sp. TY66]BCJ80295.1 hypothetical protein MTY81_16680 [Mycolicibacterium sp. TY81]
MKLLVVHHTPSPHCQEMFEAVLAGATDPEIEGVDVVRRPALTLSAADVLEADGYLLGSPANLGYMSGALKQYFVNYPSNTPRGTVACPNLLGRLAGQNTGSNRGDVSLSAGVYSRW